MENNKNRQTTLPRGRIGFSSLDVIDQVEPKYQIRRPYGLKNDMTPIDERYNECFFLHLTFIGKSIDEFLQIIYGIED